MSLRRTLVSTVIVGFAGLLAACSRTTEGGGTLTGPTPAPITPTVTAVAVAGSAPLVGTGSQLSAVATLSNATTQNVTGLASWQSSNLNVAVVSASGLVSARAAGTVDITATYNNVSGSVRFAIPQPVAISYTMSGTVTDGTSHGVLPHIQVRITAGVNVGRSTETDANGRYTLTGLTAGSCTISFAATSYQTLDRVVTIGTDMTVAFDIVLPRSAANPTPTPSPSPSPSGAFVDVTTDSRTCGCSKGTIHVSANGSAIGTTSCSSATRRFNLSPGTVTLHACDDLGCWNDRSASVGAGQVFGWLLTCSNGITAQKVNP